MTHIRRCDTTIGSVIASRLKIRFTIGDKEPVRGHLVLDCNDRQAAEFDKQYARLDLINQVAVFRKAFRMENGHD